MGFTTVVAGLQKISIRFLNQVDFLEFFLRIIFPTIHPHEPWKEIYKVNTQRLIINSTL